MGKCISILDMVLIIDKYVDWKESTSLRFGKMHCLNLQRDLPTWLEHKNRFLSVQDVFTFMEESERIRKSKESEQKLLDFAVRQFFQLKNKDDLMKQNDESLFEFEVVGTGSYYDGTASVKMDELDYLLNLKAISKLVTVQEIPNCTQEVVLQTKDPKLASFTDRFGKLSAYSLMLHFESIFEQACAKFREEIHVKGYILEYNI